MRLGMMPRRLLAESTSRDLAEIQALWILQREEANEAEHIRKHGKVEDDLRAIFGRPKK
jgi:hypothetical protein